MTKSASAAMTSHIPSTTTSLATCWQIIRKDGTILGFTDHDVDIPFDLADGNGEIIYKRETGVTRSNLNSKDDLTVSNLEAMGFLDSDEISDLDIRAGLYDNAEIRVFLVNWDSLSDGIIRLQRGWFGEFRMEDGIYTVQILGMSSALKYPILRLTKPDCDATFGDSRCGFDLSTLTQSGTVATIVEARREVTLSGINFSASGLPSFGFAQGKVVWTSGNNNTFTSEIKSQNVGSSSIRLFIQTPYAIQVGDGFDISPGCNKLIATCEFYDRVPSHRGFPHVIGRDKLLETPNAYI